MLRQSKDNIMHVLLTPLIGKYGCGQFCCMYCVWKRQPIFLYKSALYLNGLSFRLQSVIQVNTLKEDVLITLSYLPYLFDPVVGYSSRSITEIVSYWLSGAISRTYAARHSQSLNRRYYTSRSTKNVPYFFNFSSRNPPSNLPS
jgi:hypothetical protein